MTPEFERQIHFPMSLFRFPTGVVKSSLTVPATADLMVSANFLNQRLMR